MAARFALGALLLAAAGCAAGHPGGAVAPIEQVERDLQARCLHTGGIWHAGGAREGFCEYQSPGMI